MLDIYTKQNKPLPGLDKKKPKAKPPGYEEYVDPTGEFTSKELKYSLWYVKHEVLLYKFLIAGLLAIGAVTWLFSLWRWGDYLIYGLQEDSALQSQLAASYNYTGIHQHYAPQPLNILNTQILPGGVNKYDLVSEVANTNSRWLVNFEYHFVVDGKDTPSQRAFLLPGEDRLLVYFGLESVDFGSTVNLVINRVAWQRISNKLVVDTKAWQTERLNFKIDQFLFSRPGNADTPDANVITFKFANLSSYSYAEPNYYIGLYSSGALTAVLPMRLNNFISLETKDIDLRSFVVNLQADEVRAFPLINVYDPAVYLPPPM